MRRLWIVLAAVCGTLLVAVAALWFARAPLAEWALARVLDRAGLTGQARVTRLDAGGAELRDIALDRHSAGRVAIAYDLGALVSAGRIDAVTVGGLRLDVDLTAAHPLGPAPSRLLQVLPAGAGADPSGLPALPAIRLDDARIALTTARGPLVLAVDGSLAAPDETGRQAVDLSLHSRTAPDAALPLDLAGRLRGRYRAGTGAGTDLTLDVAAADGRALSLSAKAGIEGTTLSAAIDLAGAAPLLAGLAALPAGFQPTAGRASVRGSAAAPVATVLAGRPAALLADLTAADLQVAGADLVLPARATGLSLQGAARLDRTGGPPRLLLLPARASAAALDPDWLRALGLPAPLSTALAAGGQVTLDAIAGEAPMVLQADADGASAAMPAADGLTAGLNLDAGLTMADGGHVGVRLEGDLRPAPATAGAPASGTAQGRLTLRDLALPATAALDHAAMPFTLNLGPAGPDLAIGGPVTLSGLTLAPEVLAATVPADWQGLLAGSLDAVLGDQEAGAGRISRTPSGWHVRLPPRLRLQAGTALLQGLLDGSLAFEPDGALAQAQIGIADAALRRLPTPYGTVERLTLSGDLDGVPRAMAGKFRLGADLSDLAGGPAGNPDLSADLSADLAWDARALTLHMAGPGKVAVSDLGTKGGPRVRRLDLRLDDALLALATDGLRLTAAAALSPAEITTAGGSGTALDVAAGRLALDLTLPDGGSPAGRIEVAALQAGLPGNRLALEDAALAVRLDDAAVELEVGSARLRSTALPAQFPPLTVTGNGRLAGEAATYRASVRGLDGALDLAVTGRHDLARQRGSAEIRLEPLRFASGGLQPKDLNAALANLENAAGSLAGRASLRIGQAAGDPGGLGLAGSGTLRLSDIGFTIAGTIIEDLDLELALDNLLPPTSPPGQRFSVALVDAGVQLSGLAGTLRLRPGTPAASGRGEILVERAEAAFLGGRLSLADAVIDPLADRYDLALLFDEVDLEQLLDLAGLDEVSGSGRLSGTIPVTVADGRVAVRDGALDAIAPGKVAFRSAAARQALASGGESVDLLLGALEDFHYDVLRMTVDKPADGESRVFLKLEGNNPAVLDGHPFVLNISLTSNVAPLLEALARGTELSGRLVRNLLGGLAAGTGPAGGGNARPQ